MGYEHYYDDYNDVKKKRFKNKRSEIETQVGFPFPGKCFFLFSKRTFDLVFFFR